MPHRREHLSIGFEVPSGPNDRREGRRTSAALTILIRQFDGLDAPIKVKHRFSRGLPDWASAYITVHFAIDEALQEADDLKFAFPLGFAPLQRVQRRLVGAACARDDAERAASAWRLPPRLSRFRVVFPLDAGIVRRTQPGQAPSERIRSALSPTVSSISAAVPISHSHGAPTSSGTSCLVS